MMLLRFQVSNHRSIFEPVELSMIAIDEDRAATRGFERLTERVLTVAGIYGPNASGKSNVIDAIAWLSDAVATSLRSWDENIPRNAHSFGQGPDAPSTFEMDLVVGGVRYTYHLQVNDSAVLSESLHSYPERRKRTLFVRREDETDFRRGLEGVSGMQGLLTPTTLVLSAAMRFGDPAIRSVSRDIAGMGILGLRRRRFLQSDASDSSMRLFSSNHIVREAEFLDTPADRASALKLLRCADPGISDVEITEDDTHLRMSPYRRLRFIRQVDNEPFAFEFREESAGTQMWFHLIGPGLAALRTGQVLLFDEIDASLHPRLSARLLELFHDPQTNPLGAQLIFTSHDTSLLNALNRDEVWLTEKGPDGATRLVALAEFRGERVRRSVNLEKAYLQGRFGAIPEVDQVAMRKALGLVFQAPDG